MCVAVSAWCSQLTTHILLQDLWITGSPDDVVLKVNCVVMVLYASRVGGRGLQTACWIQDCGGLDSQSRFP